MSGIGNRIRIRREQLRLTQADLARLLGKDQKQVWRYENGDSQPTASALLDIAVALETTTDYLVGLTDNPERPLDNADSLTVMEKRIISYLRRKSPKASEKLLEFLDMVGA